MINVGKQMIPNGFYLVRQNKKNQSILVSSQSNLEIANQKSTENGLKQNPNILDISPQLPTTEEIRDMVQFNVDEQLFVELDQNGWIQQYFNMQMRPVAGIPDFEKTPKMTDSVKQLLNVCQDKQILLFGEQHQLQMIYFFQKNILPTLIKDGFTTVVCEVLPFDFDTAKYKQEREILYETGKISLQKTPLLYGALI